MPTRWQFRCYVSLDGIDQIHAWYDDQPRKVQGKFLSRLKALASLDVLEWKLPLFRWLHGDCVPLGEVRFEVQNSAIVAQARTYSPSHFARRSKATALFLPMRAEWH